MTAKIVKVRLSAEWGTHPTWILDADGDLEDVAPEELDLSADLTADVKAWNDEFHAFYNSDDPAASSGFRDQEAESSWMERGRELSRRIARAQPGIPVEFRYHGVSYPA